MLLFASNDCVRCVKWRGNSIHFVRSFGANGTVKWLRL